jgi:Domain of unknown function (DUF6265)
MVQPGQHRCLCGSAQRGAQVCRTADQAEWAKRGPTANQSSVSCDARSITQAATTRLKEPTMRPLNALRIALALMSSPGLVLAQDADPLAAAAWLTGCWAADGREGGSGENWMAPAGGSMLGVGRTVKDGRTVDFEFMQLRASSEGKLVFIALPAGKRETTFTLISNPAEGLVFENLQHDFPQRVIYRSPARDRLHARIEGLRSGVLRGIDFPMKRISCELTP